MRSYRLSRHKIASLCFLTSLSLLTVSCRENDSTGPRPTARLSAPQIPTRMIDVDDMCWWEMSYNCGDSFTHDGGLGGLVDPDGYAWMGGMSACYTSQVGSCGGGFGNWDDGNCIVSHANPDCLSVFGWLHDGWRGCPAEVNVNSYNATNGQEESWILTRAGTYNRMGFRMASYIGTYSTAGFSTTNVVANMVCSVGFLAAAAHG